jgi:type IV pilus assembly protein PilW
MNLSAIKSAPTQRGFTLVELMIALVIGLFLVGGLLTLVQAMKRTSVSQSGLSQLQENERMAMSLMTDVIQSAGYFNNPVVNTAASVFPVAAPFTVAGQSVFGIGAYGAAAPGNTVTVRYLTAGTGSASPDQNINCSGATSAVAATFVNLFRINSVTGNLECQLTVIVGGVSTVTTVPLINGLTNMKIYYGVQTNTGVSNNSVDSYLDATAVTAGNYWNAVKTVKVTLVFINPMYGNLPGQTTLGTTPQTINFTRIIPVMSNMGVST